MSKKVEDERFKISKEFKNRFSELISDLMYDLKCKRLEIPEKLDINATTIGKALNYGIIPKVNILVKIANYFKISIEYLLARTDDESFEVTDFPKSFQDRFEELKNAKSLTTYKVAQKTGIDIRNFTTWKQEKSYIPTLDFLIRISLFFNVTIDYLLGRTDDKQI